MEKDECKISVWLCQEEKLVSGLSRRTTCSDVVQVLLEDQKESGLLSGPPQAYCIVEKWRGFERILPNKTKILRLWSAWGEEQENVRFVLVRSDASLPNNGPRSAEARVVLSKESPGAATTLSQEKQRRVVRKAFRKLAKLNRRRQEALPKDSAARMETAVHLVLSQDHTIRQQLQRLQELDREIDSCEAKIHLERMKRHGVNYVQDTYLEEAGAERGCGEERDAEALALLEEYARKGDEVLRLQERLGAQERALEQLAAQMEQELNARWMARRQGEESSLGGELLLEQERLNTQLSTSLYIGLRLNTDLEAIRGDLDSSQRACDDKEAELQTLLATLGALDADDEDSSSPVPGSLLPDSPGDWAEPAGGLGGSKGDDDDDSDTGLSSMHSQDSDSAPLCESLV